MPSTPHSNDPRDNLGDYVLGKDGTPIVDRYGRPVRRRGASTARPQRPERVERANRIERADRIERTDRPQRPPRTARPEQTRFDTRYEPRPAPDASRGYTPRQAPQQQRPAQQRPTQQRMMQQRPPQRPPRRPTGQPLPAEQPVPMRVSRQRQAGPTPAAAPRRRRKAPGCGALLALLLAVVIALTLAVDARLTRADALPEDQIRNTAGTNWLLVGSDSRQGLSQADVDRLGTGGDIGSTRTDTIMLLHLPLTGQPTLLSIPRDSYVQIPGYGADKINAAFSYGGPKLLTETVEQNTGLRIDRYAEIGMGGLAGVVDAVGGVELCVAEPIDDPLANISLQPGCQVFDGPSALGYVRTRATAMGDLDRVQRQREFLTALMDKATSPGVLLNPFRLTALAWTLPAMFTVNTGDHVWNLARIPLALRGGLNTETVPLGGFLDTEVGSVVLWDDAAAEALFASLR
ncbi:LCP family protein [Corynebacterium sp.]|uniref:LCP family protein n=1 Tax=Corynebacterium sp. TaxID=1720 RepID=UPI002A90A9CB|nr:LCP family protein [Corynebacterium sp.]MDY5785042.1 LCP family protein [Corynebacterium sp.]